MITWLLQKAPGPRWLKALVLLALVVVIFYFLFQYFYPVINERFDGDMTVHQSSAPAVWQAPLAVDPNFLS
ncbi:hypothetical protein VRY54_02640 [Actinomyces sp. F1_1611]